jgi:regulator of protease activity HflC (stomatin/prohibitin superfamily)
MVVLRYLLIVLGIGLFVGAAALILWDLYQIFKSRKAVNLGEPAAEAPPPRWNTAWKLAVYALPPILVGTSINPVPTGFTGVRVNQFLGTRPAPLYPGVHFSIPAIESIELYDTRDNLFTTAAVDDPKKQGPEALRVQTREGLVVGLAVSVRYRLDSNKLPYIHANLPHPVDTEIIGPAISSAFRDIAPNYLVRELFSTKRDEIRQAAATRILGKLGADGIVVKEVVLRDIQLPSEYAKGLEGLLIKEQENERLNIDLDVKQKMVRTAELEADAQKAREVKEAEARAQVVVIEAKAQADAMQHTLPLKEKQIQQSRLEAEARKEATVKNAEAMAEAKVIDGKAELEKRRLMSDSDEYRIRRTAVADGERMKLEAEVLKDNPALIQKIIAEKLSDKVQIMMVPNDGKFFFANDVLKGTTVSATSH